MTKLRMDYRSNKTGYHLNLAFRFFITIIICLITNPLFGKVKEKKGLETVVIDAGHGGKDPGTVVGNFHEKDIALAIALRLGDLIKEKSPGVRVIYTRNKDIFIPLFERSVIANKNNADLFISIHVNFCTSPSIKGTETYVLGLHRTEDNLNVAKKENSAILLEKDYTTRYEGFNPNLSESYIMFELIQDANIGQSVEFAGILQDSFREHAQRTNRDVRQAGFLVLRETAMPSVLIETGYLSNPSEAKYLMSDLGRRTLALTIYNSFKLYKAKFESRLNHSFTELKKEHNGESAPPLSIKSSSENGNDTNNFQPKTKEAKIKHFKGLEIKQSVKEVDKITFVVQILAYPKKLPQNSKFFKGIEHISEIKIGDYFKYYCLETKSLTEAKHNLAKIRLKIPDAFIVALKNGQPIPLKEAINSK